MKFMDMSVEEALWFLERALVVLEYDCSTGLFRWKIRWNNACKKGWFAGTIDSYGYTEFLVLGNRIKGHQIAWLMHKGAIPQYQIDHENRNRADNRISNLRDIPQVKNMKNSKMSAANTTGHTGVNFDKSRNKWRSWITVDNRHIHLGRFSTKDEAVQVREAAELQHGFHPTHGKRV